MGIVHLAEQTHPIRRNVALKLIRRSAMAPEVVARFHAERVAMARLGHANVARVYDAGTTDDGTPFIAMEYVPGPPITEWCDARKATLEARLRLFIDVCRGVQHVHQKGLIHRDIKPQNILVTETDGRPVPKVIDFGIAKGADERLTEETLTREGGLIGTPTYLAPEALRGEAVDTRCDVYSLGMVLHRLLVGVAPLTAENGDILGLIERLADGDAVPRPSERLASLTQRARQRISALRQTTIGELDRSFRHDLDWIVVKAIESVDRRYATPGELAADIENYLDGAPVAARPPSLWYLASKAAKKRRWTLVTIGVLLAASMVGTVSTVVQAERAAEHAARAEEEAARAELERQSAQQISGFLVGLFRQANPYRVAGVEPTVREVLDRAAEDLTSEDLAPLVRADLLYTVADVYLQLALYERALEPATLSLALREAHLKSGDTLIAATLIALSHAEIRTGRFGKVLERLDRAEAIYIARDVPRKEYSRLLRTRGGYYLDTGQLAEADATFRSILRDRMSDIGPDSPLLLTDLRNLAVLAFSMGDLDQMEAWLDQADGIGVEEQRTQMPDMLGLRSQLLETRNELEPSLEFAKQAYAASLEQHGPRGTPVMSARVRVGRILINLGRHEEGLVELTAAMEEPQTTPRDRASASLGAAEVYLRQGRPMAAAKLLGEHAKTYENPNSEDALSTAAMLGRALHQAGEHADAEAPLKRALSGLLRETTPPRATVAWIRLLLADIYSSRLDHYLAAEMYTLSSLDYESEVGPDNPDTIWAIHLAGTAFHAMKAHGKAEDAYIRSMAAVHDMPSEAQRRTMYRDIIRWLEETDRTAEAAPFRRSLAALDSK